MVCGALGSFKVHVNLVLGCCRLHLDVHGGTRAFLGMVFAQDTELLDCLLLVSARFSPHDVFDGIYLLGLEDIVHNI